MRIRHLIGAASLAVTALLGTPAQAATPATQADGQALVLIPLTLTKLDDLDFGTVIPSGAPGTVSVNASSGARSFTGGVLGVASDPGFRANFAGGGTPAQQVLIALSPPVELTSGAGDTIPVLGLTLDGPPMRTIDATHAFFVGVGGTLQIASNQPEGVYSADFWVTAVYQ